MSPPRIQRVRKGFFRQAAHQETPAWLPQAVLHMGYPRRSHETSEPQARPHPWPISASHREGLPHKHGALSNGAHTRRLSDCRSYLRCNKVLPHCAHRIQATANLRALLQASVHNRPNRPRHCAASGLRRRAQPRSSPSGSALQSLQQSAENSNQNTASCLRRDSRSRQSARGANGG